MRRVSGLLISVSVIAGSAFAGQIQIGGVNGLTSAYISGGCSTNVSGQTCIAGSTGGFVEQNYDARLFTGATLGATAPTPYSGYSTTAASAGTLTDSSNPGGNGSVTYSMINDGLSGGVSNNFWDGINTSGTGTTIKVPIGVYDVSEVGTMLNNIWGAAGATDTQITFDFGSANAHTVTSSLVLNLVNAGTGTPASGQVGTSVDCATQTVTPPNCLAYAIGPLASTSVVNGVTVETDTLFSSQYDTVAAGRYMSSAGMLHLEDQVFQFGSTFSNQYLVDIQVKENSGAGLTSQTALSAITVDSALVTPEPSTILLVLAGFGALGMTRLRRRSS
jgi:hypothetical protein